MIGSMYSSAATGTGDSAAIAALATPSSSAVRNIWNGTGAAKNHTGSGVQPSPASAAETYNARRQVRGLACRRAGRLAQAQIASRIAYSGSTHATHQAIARHAKSVCSSQAVAAIEIAVVETAAGIACNICSACSRATASASRLAVSCACEAEFSAPGALIASRRGATRNTVCAAGTRRTGPGTAAAGRRPGLRGNRRS